MLSQSGADRNPYESPTEDGWVEPADEARLLVVEFEVGREANYRAAKFDFQQYRWFHQGSFALQVVVFLLLMAGLVYRLPLPWVLTAACLLIALNLGQLFLPHWWTRRRLRAAEQSGQWPVPWGHYRVEVTRDGLTLRRGESVQYWRLAELSSVFYLGDLLLIVPQPGLFLPVPRTADFGPDGFPSFCRLFALRYQQGG